jgi:hypothetical protein
MNKCVFHFWEESDKINGVTPNGCSIHIDTSERDRFLDEFYNSLSEDIPSEYDRIIGKEVYCFVSDEIYEKLVEKKSLKLLEVEKNNLISLEEIIFKPYENF